MEVWNKSFEIPPKVGAPPRQNPHPQIHYMRLRLTSKLAVMLFPEMTLLWGEAALLHLWTPESLSESKVLEILFIKPGSVWIFPFVPINFHTFDCSNDLCGRPWTHHDAEKCSLILQFSDQPNKVHLLLRPPANILITLQYKFQYLLQDINNAQCQSGYNLSKSNLMDTNCFMLSLQTNWITFLWNHM